MVTLSTFPSTELRDSGQHDLAYSDAPAAFYITAPTESYQEGCWPNKHIRHQQQTTVMSMVTHLEFLRYTRRYLHLNNLELTKATSTTLVLLVNNINGSHHKDLRSPIHCLHLNNLKPMKAPSTTLMQSSVLLVRLSLINSSSVLLVRLIHSSNLLKELLILRPLRHHLHPELTKMILVLMLLLPLHLINSSFLKEPPILRILRHCLHLNKLEPEKPSTILV